MAYWIVVIILFSLLALFIFAAWYTISKKKDTGELKFIIFLLSSILIMSIYFGIDIPCALRGGEKLYTDKRPEMLPIMLLHMVYTDEQQFMDFSGYNPDKYEQDAKYCIKYTKFTKTILKIEKVE